MRFSTIVSALRADFKNLLTDIYELKKFLEPQLARRLPQEGSAEDGEVAGVLPEVVVSRVQGAINGPQDVMRRIDELCDYYTRTSRRPPLLLRRAQRTVGMGAHGLAEGSRAGRHLGAAGGFRRPSDE